MRKIRLQIDFDGSELHSDRYSACTDIHQVSTYSLGSVFKNLFCLQVDANNFLEYSL